MDKFLTWLAGAVALSLPLLGRAQSGSDAADVGAPAQSLPYQSAFADYKPWQDIKPGDWRQLNDKVRPASGAAGHSGDGMAMPGARQSAASAPGNQASQSPMNHQGHQMPGGKQ